MLRALVLLALASICAALRVSPLTTRRHAVVAGATVATGAMLPLRAAHADAIEDIARRNAEESKIAAERKAAAKDAQVLVDAGEGVLNTALTVGALGLLGFAATFFSGIKSQSDATTVVNFENSRPLTDAEKAKYKNLSASEKKKLGIKGF